MDAGGNLLAYFIRGGGLRLGLLVSAATRRLHPPIVLASNEVVLVEGVGVEPRRLLRVGGRLTDWLGQFNLNLLFKVLIT
jgi:hypothetical protein